MASSRGARPAADRFTPNPYLPPWSNVSLAGLRGVPFRTKEQLARVTTGLSRVWLRMSRPVPMLDILGSMARRVP